MNMLKKFVGACLPNSLYVQFELAMDSSVTPYKNRFGLRQKIITTPPNRIPAREISRARKFFPGYIRNKLTRVAFRRLRNLDFLISIRRNVTKSQKPVRQRVFHCKYLWMQAHLCFLELTRASEYILSLD